VLSPEVSRAVEDIPEFESFSRDSCELVLSLASLVSAGVPD
jgi:hypothetical protein